MIHIDTLFSLVRTDLEIRAEEVVLVDNTDGVSIIVKSESKFQVPTKNEGLNPIRSSMDY